MNRSRTAVVLTALLAGGLALSACGGGDSTSAESGGTPTIKYGIYGPGLDSGVLLMAEKLDTWADHGVNVEVVEFNGAAQGFPALLSGDVDVLQANPSEALLASEQGAQLSIIGSTMPGLNFALYGNERYGSIADLRGATIGASTPTALPSVVAKAMLLTEGITPDEITDANTSGTADSYAAVVAGTTDATISTTDYLDRAESDGVKVLGLARDLVPDYPRYAIIARNDFLEGNPDAPVGLLAGLLEGMRHALENEDEANALTAEITELPADDPSIASAFELFRDDGYFDVNGRVPVKQVEYLADLQVELGLAPSRIDPQPLIDESFQQEALEIVGEVPDTYYGAQ